MQNDHLRRAVKLLPDAGAPFSRQNTRYCGITIAGGPSGGGLNSIVVPSAVTVEYWYPISGSQPAPLAH